MVDVTFFELGLSFSSSTFDAVCGQGEWSKAEESCDPTDDGCPLCGEACGLLFCYIFISPPVNPLLSLAHLPDAFQGEFSTNERLHCNGGWDEALNVIYMWRESPKRVSQHEEIRALWSLLPCFISCDIRSRLKMQKSDCRHGQEGRQHNHCWNKEKESKGDSQGSHKCQWSKDSSEKKTGCGSSSHGHNHEHSHHHHGHNHGSDKSHEHHCSHGSKKN